MPVYELTLTAIAPQGVPGEPESGVWTGRKVAARDETHAVEVAERLFSGWTVIRLTDTEGE